MATFHQQVLRVKDMDYFPMVMVANKCDLEKERQVSTMEGYAMAKKIGCPFVETSAKQRINVDEASMTLFAKSGGLCGTNPLSTMLLPQVLLLVRRVLLHISAKMVKRKAVKDVSSFNVPQVILTSGIHLIVR